MGLFDIVFVVAVIVSQIGAIIGYGVAFKTPVQAVKEHIPGHQGGDLQLGAYPMFQDIHIMIFVGFGFLLTAFHKFRLTSLTMCFWVAALCVQYYFLFNFMWEKSIPKEDGHKPEKIVLTTIKLITGEVSAGAILIAVCAVIGKVNSLQLFIMTIWGVFLYSLNEVIVFNKIQALDAGGSMIIHTFGAFYGLGITFICKNKFSKDNKNMFETHESLVSSMLGTLFLWCYWPSFNAVLAGGEVGIANSIFNTYFSLISSVLTAYATSLLLGKGKFTMSHILNATLAGGIIVGACADFLEDAWVAYLCGSLIGIISTLLFNFMPKAFEKIGLQDVAGVFHLHGLPGILGGIVSGIARASYGDKAGKQFLGLLTSIGFGLIGGIIIGFALKFTDDGKASNDYFNDLKNVHLEGSAKAALEQYGESPEFCETSRPLNDRQVQPEELKINEKTKPDENNIQA